MAKGNPLVFMSRTKYIYGIMLGLFGLLFVFFRLFAFNNRYAKPEDRMMTLILALICLTVSAVLFASSYLDYRKEFLRLERLFLQMKQQYPGPVTAEIFSDYAQIAREEAIIFMSRYRDESGTPYSQKIFYN